MVADNSELPAPSLEASASQKAPEAASARPENREPAADSGAATPDGRDGPNNKRKHQAPAGRGGRGRGGKRKEFGRKGANQERPGRQERENQWREHKRRRVEKKENTATGAESYMSIKFPEAEIAAEERRPKRKMAVMIGYAGTGYHGLQINHDHKTIEGEIFAAFVRAKAISKANADDPQKSSFVRCARTDKGVHAAGNMLSLKLITGEPDLVPDLVKKINDELPPQIRIWGMQRTNNPFSCYTACDSRWYEYLMPSYCLLPPHPESFLGKKIAESVKERGLEEEYTKRLVDFTNYWEEVEKNDIQPIMDRLSPETREAVQNRMHSADNPSAEKNAAGEKAPDVSSTHKEGADEEQTVGSRDVAPGVDEEPEAASKMAATEEDSTLAAELASAPANGLTDQTKDPILDEVKPKELSPVDQALKDIKAAYVSAKRRYRVTPGHLAQLQEALDQYVGTKNFHNYTVQKPYADPSAKRNIKSFIVNTQPVQINDTEWLSLKVHGQSFMMHQIRKMVGMAVLVTRCATPYSVMADSYAETRISIPKAPSLGLLLERPVFENYNKRAVESYNLAELDFGNYEKEIQEFKDAHIYRRIFESEERENAFHAFFNQIDNFKSGYFLWVTAGGIAAAKTRVGLTEGVGPAELEAELGVDEEDPAGAEEET
ncbi:pseudouridine synthase [Xylariaceae sp. FL0804]|nr:pseudouridine synthase [Xylariaceae sp. FL0804]